MSTPPPEHHGPYDPYGPPPGGGQFETPGYPGYPRYPGYPGYADGYQHPHGPAPGYYPGAGFGGGPSPFGQYPPPQPYPTYVWQSVVLIVLSSCLCFLLLPFPILAISSASKVDRLMRIGDYEGARSASRAAKAWCITSAATIAVPVLSLILVLVVAGMPAESGS